MTKPTYNAPRNVYTFLYRVSISCLDIFFFFLFTRKVVFSFLRCIRDDAKMDRSERNARYTHVCRAFQKSKCHFDFYSCRSSLSFPNSRLYLVNFFDLSIRRLSSFCYNLNGKNYKFKRSIVFILSAKTCKIS